jgi:hypothetical protein
MLYSEGTKFVVLSRKELQTPSCIIKKGSNILTHFSKILLLRREANSDLIIKQLFGPRNYLPPVLPALLTPK